MKLADLEILITTPPAPGWGGRYWIFVKLTTDDGITGWGECYAASVGPAAMEAVIGDVFARHFQGENPENIELLFRRAYSSGFTQRPDLTVIGALSGLEIACWYILGKARDRPVWALLGGRMNDRIRAYSYIYPLPHHDKTAFWTSPDMAAEAALDMVNRGYTAVKFDPAGPYTLHGGHQPAMTDISLSVAFCKAIREAIGDRADLLFGTHGQFTTAGAIRLGQALEPYNPLWFEEPVPPDNLAEFAQVAASVRIPLATGERLTTKAEFGALLRHGGVRILQPALGRSGGIWEAKNHYSRLTFTEGDWSWPTMRLASIFGRESPSSKFAICSAMKTRPGNGSRPPAGRAAHIVLTAAPSTCRAMCATRKCHIVVGIARTSRFSR